MVTYIGVNIGLGYGLLHDGTKPLPENHVGLSSLTLNVRRPSYLGLTRSISWLPMPWLLMSPGHQQPWYWLCRICRSNSYLRKDFKYLCYINVEHAPALKPECIYFKWQYHYICDECVKRISAMCEWSQCLTANYECFQCETERYLRTDCVCCATIMTISLCTCLSSHVCACNLSQNAVYCKYINRATRKTTGNVFKKSYHYGE